MWEESSEHWSGSAWTCSTTRRPLAPKTVARRPLAPSPHIGRARLSSRRPRTSHLSQQYGATVTSAMHGRCRVLEVETRVCNTRLMRFVLATGIMEIQCRRVWHAVRAYHRCALLSVPSESLAETVGYVLRDASNKAAGRPKPVDVFVRAAHIRLAGLRGHGGEEGVLSDALNLYFNARGRRSGISRKPKMAPQ